MGLLSKAGTTALMIEMARRDVEHNDDFRGFRIYEQDGQTIFPRQEGDGVVYGSFAMGVQEIATGRIALVRIDPFNTEEMAKRGLLASIREGIAKLKEVPCDSSPTTT